MTVVVTGAAGYIGSSLCTLLGPGTVGVDIRAGQHVNYMLDVRDPEFVDVLDGATTLVHLAAISWAPEHHDIDDLIYDSNVETVRAVVDAAERAGVLRIVFASSASVFEGCRHEASEATDPHPLSAYGMSKVDGERIVSRSSVPSRVIVRAGTATGLGLLPRTDLVVHRMALDALATGVIHVTGGRQWRPLAGLRNIVLAYEAACHAEAMLQAQLVHVVDANVQVGWIAEEIAAQTECRIVRVANTEARSYRVMPSAGPLSLEALVSGVLREARGRLNELWSGADPRQVRLDELRSVHR